MQRQSPLHALAEIVGILPKYVDQTGKETRWTADETRVAFLTAMGIDVTTPTAAEASLRALEERLDARLLAPARVVRASDLDARDVLVRVPERWGAEVRWSLEWTPEGGEGRSTEGSAQPEWGGAMRIPLGTEPPKGYHEVRVTLRCGDEERSGEQALIVVPDRCPSAADLAGRERVFGVIANLYTVRSGENWGVGDLEDLARLMEWTGEVGGAFVGVNPLHALRNRGTEISPYSPVSRVFRNPLYLSVPAVPELAGSQEARWVLADPAAHAEMSALREGDRVEYERVMRLKRRALEAAHQDFAAAHGDGGTERGRAYRAFLEEQGESLERFATFEAIADELGGDWREWPEPLHDPSSPEVEAFRAEHSDRVDLHRWLQFEMDRQLGDAAARGERAGLGIGLYQDLAIGTSPTGADVWSNPGLFLDGVSIGAPPDEYSATGQNWGLPPLNPWALREEGYRFWIRLVRATMRHGGALRIDHAVGLFRQFWIPEGKDGSEGAYLRFPYEDLLGILALEAHRHGALVVGEDLGTVPDEVPPVLRRWGVHSSRVLYFEKDDDGFHPAESYEPMSLATANTHDMPTLAGFWAGRDIEVKREVGMIESDEEAEEEREAREVEKRTLLERLAAEGVLPEAVEPESEAELRGAVHDFLCRTPAALVGFSLDDLVGEAEPVNVPGVGPEDFSSWTRRLNVPLEALAESDEVRAALRCGGRRG